MRFKIVRTLAAAVVLLLVLYGMTQDVYMGRRAVDSRTARALETALRGASPDAVKGGKGWPKKKARNRDDS